MNLKDNFDKWFLEYQEDLVKIIGKHRYNNHALDAEEMLSEINLAILKDKEKILNSDIDSQKDLGKLMYSYARNHIKWKSDGSSSRDKKYIKNKQDSVHTGEDGSSITLFDLVCNIEGKEDESQSILKKSNKSANIIKYIKKYSHFLTPHQKNVFDLLLMGKNYPQMAALLGVTHQAVQSVCSDIVERIKSFVKVDVNAEDESKLLSKGHYSINYLFGEGRIKYRAELSTSIGLKNK